MGTKSHISKGLPASIMTKRIGLIVLQQAAFSTAREYLYFPSTLSLCKTEGRGNLFVGENTRGDFCLSILFYSVVFYMGALV